MLSLPPTGGSFVPYSGVRRTLSLVLTAGSSSVLSSGAQRTLQPPPGRMTTTRLLPSTRLLRTESLCKTCSSVRHRLHLCVQLYEQRQWSHISFAWLALSLSRIHLVFMIYARLELNSSYGTHSNTTNSIIQLSDTRSQYSSWLLYVNLSHVFNHHNHKTKYAISSIMFQRLFKCLNIRI